VMMMTTTRTTARDDACCATTSACPGNFFFKMRIEKTEEKCGPDMNGKKKREGEREREADKGMMNRQLIDGNFGQVCLPKIKGKRKK